MEIDNTQADKTQQNNRFWQKLENTEGLSIQTGLTRVSGRREAYQQSLKLMLREIEKCVRNLHDFLAEADMQNFCIEVHSMKSSLANIGVMELSSAAYELEKASDKNDAAFCNANLPSFTEKLSLLGEKLKEAFLEISQNNGPIAIPPELPPIFEKLEAAFAGMDLLTIDSCIENMDALNPEGGLKEEIEQIKDAVLIMDYDEATGVMRRLLKETKSRPGA